MADLLSFLDDLRRHDPDDLVTVDAAVSADREPAALLRRLEDGGRSPVVLFARVGDSAIPVVTNVHATRARLALALGVDETDLNRVYQQRLAAPIEPVRVASGPVQETVVTGPDVDLRALPLIRPSDNCVAPYLGAGIVVAKDPDTGIANLSYNRLMLRGPNRFTFHAAPGLHLNAIHRKAEARGEALPVAIIVGVHPAMALGVLAKVPFGVDELTCAGAMLREPVRVVRCRTVPLDVPASAQIVLEGRVLPHVREPEGPYDEFTGFAMPQELQTVIEITAMTSRREPVMQDIFGGGREHLLMGAVPKESTLEARLAARHPSVRGVRLASSGCGRLHAYVRLDRHEPGEPRSVIDTLFGLDHFLKHVWVVDADVDILRDDQVLWAMATCFQGDRDSVVLADRLGSSLDPSAGAGALGAKVGFDCTRKRPDFPPRNRIDPDVLARMDPARYVGRR